MLIVFLIVHLLSSKGHQSQGLRLDPRAPNGSCDDINNCRRLFDIVWGCLTTIFACTWVSAHPNVPPPKPIQPYSFWPKLEWMFVVAITSLWRKLKLMLIAVIAPELVVGFAARQCFVAWKFSNEFDISWTHSYFISMGGFVTGKGGHPIVTREQVIQHLSAIKAVPEELIEDKSKGDALSKGVALLQGVWFVTQCVARVAQRLPVTELEVATLAFAVLNVFVWVLWWGKPLDVQEPIAIGPVRDMTVVKLRALSRWNRFTAVFSGIYVDYNPLFSNSVPSFWSISYDDDHGPASSYIYTGIPVLAEVFVGTLFGAIHCAAWNASFPSADERWMWRSSAIMVTAIPLPILLSAVSLNGGTTLNIGAPYIGIDSDFVVMLLVPLYTTARLFLIILPLVALRALPSDAFVDVNWSVYIPHL
ncbi:hypothetical protein GGX14DRAFT_522257 [Mycena pura]|uniref:Uncharacterized protein n=1 Tax=Mycena pura TaxID=153505 RepID=A0AAD6VA60_9AGAR|nr:hypothetical protein GGX14DRAFT_522257 [Mycena pura]